MSRVDQDNSLINLSGPENISNITTFLLMPLLNNSGSSTSSTRTLKDKCRPSFDLVGKYKKDNKKMVSSTEQYYFAAKYTKPGKDL